MGVQRLEGMRLRLGAWLLFCFQLSACGSEGSNTKECDADQIKNAAGECVDPSVVNPSTCREDPQVCHSNATCENTGAGWTCQCGPGYTGDGVRCEETESLCANPPDLVSARTLASFTPFAAARKEWAQELAKRSAEAGQPPYPPLVSPLDPYKTEFWSAYGIAWETPGNLFLPFGTPPTSFINWEQAGKHSSLILSEDAPASLFRLTDFSTDDSKPRVAALCEYFLASAGQESVARLASLCGDLGRSVPNRDVANLKVTGVRLLRARECGLPSLAYKHFLTGIPNYDPPEPIEFAWPDFHERAAEFRQPCLGIYLHVEAADDAGQVLGKGWMFAKAVADLSQVAFPFMELDWHHGDLASDNGAPRGEFVSTRQIFNDGVSLYLGNTPLWLMPTTMFTSMPAVEVAKEFVKMQPLCDLSTNEPILPCILPPQQPFLFPATGANTIWLRQALDARHACFDPTFVRNEFEGGWDYLSLGAMLEDARATFASTDFSQLSTAELERQGENLGAMFHAFRLYQGGKSKNFQRFRGALLGLGQDTVLVVPDQGYFQVGSPDPDTLARLQALVDGGVDLHQWTAAAEPYEIVDFVSAPPL